MTKKMIISCVLSLVFGSQLCAQDKNSSFGNTEKSTAIAKFPLKPVLYFVDGVQVKPTFPAITATSPLSSMNPNDIERIDIIKGENAVAKYGGDAVSGVVLNNNKKEIER